MASASYTLKEHDTTTDIVLTLVGNTSDGAQYRVSSRSLALPQSLDITMSVGNPGAKGNDHVKFVFKNVKENGTTGAICTGSVSVDLSIPRDSAWLDEDSKDLLAEVANFLTSANRTALADALVP